MRSQGPHSNSRASPIQGAEAVRVPVTLILTFAGLVCSLAADGAEPKSGAPVPPGFSLARQGDVHDFDYFAGGWTTRQRKLEARGVGSKDWEEFPGTLCMTLYLDGGVTVDELYFPTQHSSGLTLRTFDRAKRQ